MRILVAQDPCENAYIASLIDAYRRRGHHVISGSSKFFSSNEKIDVLHLQWPESLYRWGTCASGNASVGEIAARLDWFKELGSTIVYTAHNIEPHEQDAIGQEVYRLFLDRSEIIAHHGKASIDMLMAAFPELKRKRHIVCRHGDYLIEFQRRTKAICREELGIPMHRIVILHFGLLRQYKGLDFVLQVFRRASVQQSHLLIAGRADDIVLRRKLRVRSAIAKLLRRPETFLIRSIRQSEVPTLFCCADLLLLGHSKGLTTGLIPLAATYGLPVVYPELGCFAEQAEGWRSRGYAPQDCSSACVAVRELIGQRNLPNNDEARDHWLAANSWLRHVDAIIQAVGAHRA